MTTNSPICKYDNKECEKFDSIECRADCHNCHREFNGVRATGSMPTLEWITKSIKKLLK